jgi:SNF2 family DNA or RNA helicase
MTEVRGAGANRLVIRQITETEVIKAHQRIEAIGRIARENVDKFLSNPSAFILHGDESADEVAIDFSSYRITGMGTPYIGYFGSKNLDSPIKQALIQDGNPSVHEEIRQWVIESVDKQSVAKVKTLIEKIEQAEKSNTQQTELPNGEILPKSWFEVAKITLKKIADKAIAQAGISADKLVLQIKANDEHGVDFDFITRKPLNEIRTNHQDKGDLFNAIAFQPKSYQVAGVNWLKDLFEADYRGGILADDMGLGKTYQLVVFMNHLLGLPQYQGKDAQRTLIVAPTILLDNWCDEINKFVADRAALERFQIRIFRGADLSY